MNRSLRHSLAMGVSCLCGFVGSECFFPGEAKADWHSFRKGLHVAYARTQAWPQPFTDVDARHTTAPFDAMKHNGWRLHNTLGTELFRDSDAALVSAGHNRVRWIVSQAPGERRVIYVLRGRTPQETEARLASVRQSIAALNTPGAPPQLVVTDIEPTTASGAWATQINRDWMEALPEPKLPGTSATGSEGAVEGG